MKFTPTEFIIYGAIFGAVFGVVLGLIILFLGIKKGKRNLGIIGLVCSILVGPISGILSLIVMGIFIWLILKKPQTVPPIEVVVVNKTPIDVKVENFENR
jgi:hypothetical protein